MVFYFNQSWDIFKGNNMKKLKNTRSILEKRDLIWWFILVSLIISMISYSIRDTSAVPGLESQYNQRVAESSLFNYLHHEQDPLQVHKTDLRINLYHFFLKGILFFPAWITKGITILLSLVVLFLFRMVMKELKVSLLISNITLAVLILTPIFIYYSVVYSVLSIVGILILSILLCLKKKKLRWIAFILSIILTFMGIKIVVISLFIILSYVLYLNRIHYFYIIAGCQSLTYGILTLFSVVPELVPLPLMNSMDILKEIIAEFGGLRSIGVMAIALFVYGFAKEFSDKKTRNAQLLFVLAIVSLLFFEYRIMYFASFVIAFYAAIAIRSLMKREWHSNELKQLTLLIIACGLIFTSISYVKQIELLEPTSEQAEALTWFKTYGSKGNVLTYPSYAPYIQNIAQKPVLIDTFHYNYKILNDIETMFTSRDLVTTSRLMRLYGIKYIYLNEEMKQTIWESKEEGLQFLFSNENYFKRIYFNPGNLEIWEFLG